MANEIEESVLKLRQKKFSALEERKMADEIDKRIFELRKMKGRYCPQCGINHKANGSFCVYCGTELV